MMNGWRIRPTNVNTPRRRRDAAAGASQKPLAARLRSEFANSVSTSQEHSLSSSNWVGCREGLIFDIGLTRLETVVEAAEEAVEEVALLATRTCDRGGASIRLEASGVGKASRVVADLGQQTCRGQL